MDEDIAEPRDERPVSRLELFSLIQAYNRGEISLDDWLKLSRAWAEALLRQHGFPEPTASD